MLYPLLLDPIYHDHLWGGREIVTKYARSAPAQKRYAESWEISDRKEYNSQIHNGPLKGSLLREILTTFPFEMYGTLNAPDRFPLLIKLIDAHLPLSIQVHPDELSAKEHDTEAKTECWYILDAKKDSRIFAGLKRPLSKEAFQEIAGTENLCKAMRTYTTKTGDVFVIPGGRLHSIGAGVLLLEIQQNSNTTYRVYDWDRLQEDGTPRELHLKQAAECVHLDDIELSKITTRPAGQDEQYLVTSLVDTTAFSMKHVVAKENVRLNKTDPGCEVLFFEEGEGTIFFENHSLPVSPGMTVLIPHVCKKVTLETRGVHFIVIKPHL